LLAKELEEKLSKAPIEEVHSKASIGPIDLYDLVFDFSSLVKFKDGWQIKEKIKGQELYSKILTGKIVAVVGKFKSGKTWLINKLIDKNLGDHPINSTEGISVITSSLPSDFKSIIDSTTDVKPKKVFKKQQKTTDSAPVKEKPLEFDYIFLDTAGTEVPCSQSELDDKRATQYFLRDIVLQVATKVIFVTTKFDQDVQSTIKDLISHLNTINKNIEPNNRLFIVHNMIDISTQSDLQKRINIVAECYKYEEDDEKYGHIKPWVPHQYKTSILFDTRYTKHIFLVNNNEFTKFEYDTWRPDQYNTDTLECLKLELRQIAPIDIQLWPQMQKYMKDNIDKFIKNWQHDIVKEIDDEKDVFVLPQLLGEENTDDNSKEQVEDIEVFELASLKYTRFAVISDSIIQLEGSYAVNEKEKTRLLSVYVRAPGFKPEHKNKENLQLKFNRKENEIIVIVHILSPTCDSGFEFPPEVTLRKVKGNYKCQLPENRRYLLPRDLSKFYLKEDNSIIIANGEIVINFELEPPIDDE